MRILVLGLLLGISIISQGQKTEYDHISAGNKLYKDSSFVKASNQYKQAQELNANSFESVFNLGNALYNQDSLEAAAHQFQLAASMSDNELKQAEAFHNLGNAYLQQKDYQKSIDAYKNALRRNSSDEDTRYNLSYARKMLENQPQDQDRDKDDQDKDDQENDDQDKDKGDQDQGDQNDDNKEQNDDSKDQDKDQGDDKRDQDKQNQKDQDKAGMSPEEAEKLLNALEQDESDLRKGIRIQEDNTDPKQIDKNW